MSEVAVIYVRYSSENQRGGFSVAAQLDSCRKYAQSQGWHILNEYIDEAKSGRSDQRDNFQRMISDVIGGGVDYIVVHKFNRFGRNRYDQIIYKSKLKDKGVRVVSVSEPLDANNPLSIVMEALHEAWGEVESIDKAHECMKGMIQGAKEGFWQTAIPYGYMPHKVDHHGKLKNKLIPHPEHSLIVKEMFQMYSSGDYGLKQICTHFNSQGIKTNKGGDFSVSTLERILKNRVYLGEMNFNQNGTRNDYEHVQIKDSHPAIISEDIFDRVQIVGSSRMYVRSDHSKDYLLSGVLRCGCCSGAMVGYSVLNHQKRKYEYYACTNKIKKGLVVCNATNITKADLEDKIKHIVEKELFTPSFLGSIAEQMIEDVLDFVKTGKERISGIETKILNIQKKRTRLLAFIEDGDDALTMDDLRGRLKELKKQENEASNQLESLKFRYSSIMKVDFLDSELMGKLAIEIFEELTQTEFLKGKRIKSIINTITITGDRVDIEYHLPEFKNSSNCFPKGSKLLKNELNMVALIGSCTNLSKVYNFSFRLAA